MSEEHPILAASARPPDRTEVTGPAPTERFDVWEPAPDRPDRHERGVTLALVHGGFWRAAYDRTHLGPLAAALADDGFHVANLEYARVGMPGGGWSGTGRSVEAGLRAVLADEDLPSHAVVVGHSAGGHLALWLASRPDPPAGLVGAVALAPASALRVVHDLGLSDGAAEALLGCSPDDGPEAWAEADPARHPLTVPTVVLTGGRDDVVPDAVDAAYRRSRTPADPVHFGVVASADHFDLIDPSHEAYFTLLAHLEELTLHLR